MARILVVDDQTSVLVMLEGILLSQGHAVTCVTNPVEAMDKLNEYPYDLVISDIVMPGGFSGFDLIKGMKSNKAFAQIPIVMLSGKREKKDVERGILSGADDYIVKPIDPDVFLLKIETILKLKAPDSLNFVECQVRDVFQWEAMNDIVAISEVGVTLNSTLSVEPGTRLKIRSPFLDTLGLFSPKLRVISCEKAKAEPAYFVIKAQFIGLTESSLQPLRLWIRKNQIKSA